MATHNIAANTMHLFPGRIDATTCSKTRRPTPKCSCQAYHNACSRPTSAANINHEYPLWRRGGHYWRLRGHSRSWATPVLNMKRTAGAHYRFAARDHNKPDSQTSVEIEDHQGRTLWQRQRIEATNRHTHNSTPLFSLCHFLFCLCMCLQFAGIRRFMCGQKLTST